MDFKAIYAHFQFVEECEHEYAAQQFVQFWTELIKTLEPTFNVYTRVLPHYERDRKFESDSVTYIARCRFSVSPILILTDPV